MATELTPNGKLRIPSSLDTDSRFNLNKLDSLFASGMFDSNGNLTLRSKGNIIFRPGNGVGGSLSFNQKITSLDINATTININSDALFTGGFLIPRANLDLSSLSTSDVSDFDTAVSANVSVTANTSHRGDSSIHFTEASISHDNIQDVGTNSHSEIDDHISSLANPHSVSAAQTGAYTTGQVDTLLGNKSDVGHTHISTNITDLDATISANTDVALNTTHRGGGGNPHSVTAAQTGADTSAEVTTKVSDHASLSTTHGVIGSIVGTTDTQTLTNKTIDLGSNTLTGIVDANVDAAAAISGSKIDPDFGNQVINTNDGITFNEGGFKAKLRAAQSGMMADVTWDLPEEDGTNGQVIATNGSGELTFISVSGVGGETAVSWLAADGTSKTINHNFGSRNVTAEIVDANDSYRTIEVDSITRPTDNDITLTASSAPTTSWIVLLKLIS